MFLSLAGGSLDITVTDKVEKGTFVEGRWCWQDFLFFVS